ncbi:MurR/RpiR family transcriptional regulator [Lacticaseibacillus daqingensis]|uniref:MurR/RpiR family transcriptional regulator n=1 Tax=Lacticaseibacillus daqingensis TaxID=2486014 RepID=UPI001CDD2955|nr:MurR/RpiR family transcriptional regulator [Lacticaseibacillus daqingensis]
MSLFNRYKSILSTSELALLTELSRHANEIPGSTISTMATQLFISKSTLYRLIRKLGFDGYSTFKYRVSDSLVEETPKYPAPSNLLDMTINQINKTYALNQAQLTSAARLFLGADARYVYGTGWKQKQVVDNFSTDLLIYGEQSLTLRNKTDLANAVTHMTSNDLLLFTSMSGTLSGYEDTADEIHLRGIPIISVTSDAPTSLSKEASISLFFASEPSRAGRLHWQITSMSFAFDLLIQAILIERNKQESLPAVSFNEK